MGSHLATPNCNIESDRPSSPGRQSKAADAHRSLTVEEEAAEFYRLQDAFDATLEPSEADSSNHRRKQQGPPAQHAVAWDSRGRQAVNRLSLQRRGGESYR